MPCFHEFHLTCIRDYARSLTRRRADLVCPLCKKIVARHVVEELLVEVRLLSYTCTLSPEISRRRGLLLKIIVQREGSEDVYMDTEKIRIEDLPQHSNGQRFVIQDIEVRVTDPQTRFRVWMEEEGTQLKLTPMTDLTSSVIEEPPPWMSCSDSEEEAPPAPPMEETAPASTSFTAAVDAAVASTSFAAAPVASTSSAAASTSSAAVPADAPKKKKKNPPKDSLTVAREREQRLLENVKKRIEQLAAAERRVKRHELALSRAREDMHRTAEKLQEASVKLVQNRRRDL